MPDLDGEYEVSGSGREGVYLFGFARAHTLRGVEGSCGDNETPLAEWVFQDVAAVFRRVALDEWTGESSEKNLQDLAWVGPRACIHEKVVEQIMAGSPVLPARFATLFSSLDHLAQLVVSQYSVISAFLDSVVGKEEWAVKMLLDRAQAEEHLLVSAPSSQSREAGASPGRSYLCEQRLRGEIRKKLDSWVTEITHQIAGELDAHIVASRSLKSLARNASGRDKEMTFNWAFLLRQDRRDQFHACLNEIAAQFAGQGVSLDASGPWPPYSFCPSLEREAPSAREAGAPS
ncbi:MAG: GvpL/GvpF family gas vesicle protein [Candidatus Sumerlaeota bacterium]|nr:GvpL/GvpF family gas vesicle protein [Candidatus Sumerlaeota bacterium]